MQITAQELSNLLPKDFWVTNQNSLVEESFRLIDAMEIEENRNLKLSLDDFGYKGRDVWSSFEEWAISFTTETGAVVKALYYNEEQYNSAIKKLGAMSDE